MCAALGCTALDFPAADEAASGHAAEEASTACVPALTFADSGWGIVFSPNNAAFYSYRTLYFKKCQECFSTWSSLHRELQLVHANTTRNVLFAIRPCLTHDHCSLRYINLTFDHCPAAESCLFGLPFLQTRLGPEVRCKRNLF